MSLRSDILSNLSRLPGIPGPETNSYRFEASQVLLDHIPVPVRQCDFSLSSSIDNFSTNWFLTSIKTPEAGINFTTNPCGYLQMPTVSVEPGSFTTIIPSSWQGNIMNLYYRQFRHGLLSADYDSVDINFNYRRVVDDLEDSAMKKATVAAAEAAVSAVPGISYGVGGGTIKDLYSKVNNTPEFIILATFEDCKFGLPHISVNPSSTEFVQVTMPFSCNNIYYSAPGGGYY